MARYRAVGKCAPLAERLQRRLTVDENDCWIWQGHTRNGYGRLNMGAAYGRRRIDAHRLAYQLAHGPIEDGLVVCHHCDVRACCNPTHLFLGTQRQNMDDMLAKGRSSPGELRPQARLTTEAVRAIRAASGFTQQELAERYGVSQSNISAVLLRKSWRHVA